MQNYSDEQLIAHYLKGDEKALKFLISRYLKPIYRFVYRNVGNTSDAEDITQEVFVKVWRHLGKFDRNKSFKTWIFKIAQNTSIDFLRKKKVTLFSEFDDAEGKNAIAETLIDPAPLPEEIFDRNNLNRELTSAIEKLPLKYRIVLFLHYNDHFTFQEIADVTGEPLDTIKSRHRRAIIELRKILMR
jgi:RNA polymerase sigma-70 factor (ECF subfamily)